MSSELHNVHNDSAQPRSAKLPLDPELLAFARRLRQEHSDPERLMWALLRDRRLGGAKFRRQHPVGCYVLDFYCHRAKLAVELDGGQHNTPEARAHDENRSAFLAKQGIAVVRFWNHEVLEESETVLEAFYRAVMGRRS
jgi:very-short-patch-repair endonuclease